MYKTGVFNFELAKRVCLSRVQIVKIYQVIIKTVSMFFLLIARPHALLYREQRFIHSFIHFILMQANKQCTKIDNIRKLIAVLNLDIAYG